MSLRRRVEQVLDRIPPSVGVLVYDRDLRLLAERDPLDGAKVVILDRKPHRYPDRPRLIRDRDEPSDGGLIWAEDQ